MEGIVNWAKPDGLQDELGAGQVERFGVRVFSVQELGGGKPEQGTGAAAHDARAGCAAELVESFLVDGLDQHGTDVVDAVDLLQVLALAFYAKVEIGPELHFHVRALHGL